MAACAKKTVQPVWIAHGYIQTDNATIAPANEIHLVDMQIIEQRHVIIGHQPVSDRLVGPGGTALSATVGDDDGMMAGENGKLGIPDVLVGKAAMDQQDRRPLPTTR